MLSGLFVGLGATRGAADFYADRIIAWRASPQPGAPEESSYYRAAGLIYSPRGAPFQQSAELGLVLGIPEAMVERAMPFVTVYSRSGRHHAMDAAPQVLAALPGMDPSRLDAVLNERAGGRRNAQRVQAMLGAAQVLGGAQGARRSVSPHAPHSTAGSA